MVRCYDEDAESYSGKMIPANLVIFSVDVNGLKMVNDISGSTITLTNNGITTALGSQNSGWFHISTTGAPVYFGESIAVDGNISFYNHASMQYNTTEDCIEFVFA